MIEETIPKKPAPAAEMSLRHEWRRFLQMLVVLFKLRVVSLLLLAAVGGAFLGAAGWPGFGTLLLVLCAGGLAASGAAAWNQYLERNSDHLMGRTNKRPLVNGDIPNPRWIPWIASAMILLPVLLMLPSNPALSFFLMLGAIIYVGVYTIWLKPRTLLNIVIGGAAGSAAVLTGGAAAGAWQDPGVIVLALLVFAWTPTHFWSLAILYRDDYQRADVPMLPARTSLRAAAWWVMVHTLLTGFAAMLLGLAPALGWLYLAPVTLLTVDMVRRNVRLIREPNPKHALALFIASNTYLMIILLAASIDAVI
jgi:protoheme IX farnesyltransferase